MRGIALKIFLSFWLIFVVLIASFALLPDPGLGVRFQDHLRAHSAVATRLFERHGALSCSDYVAAVAESRGVRLALFDAQGTAVCHAPGEASTLAQSR